MPHTGKNHLKLPEQPELQDPAWNDDSTAEMCWSWAHGAGVCVDAKEDFPACYRPARSALYRDLTPFALKMSVCSTQPVHVSWGFASKNPINKAQVSPIFTVPIVLILTHFIHHMQYLALIMISNTIKAAFKQVKLLWLTK